MNEEYIDISSPLFPNSQNIQDDGIKKTQENLIMMGFDIEMVNKIISTFKIRTEEEALDYLIKNENGMWEHPFIPKVEEEEEEDKKSIISSLSKSNKNNKIKLSEDICEICGESKNVHLIKEFNSNNNNNNNNNLNFPNNGSINENNNIIIKEGDDQEEEEEINDINPKECEICMSDLENSITIISCKHQFCQDCFHSYLINLI